MSVSINQNNLFIKACEHADAGRFSESLEIFYKLEEVFPNEAVLHFLMGMCEYELKKLANARNSLERCLQINPLLIQANHLLGNVLRDLGSFDLAIDSYKKEIGLDPNYPDVLNDLGMLYFIKDDYDKAKDAYDQALKIDYGYADAYQNKAMIHIRQKEFDEAKKLLENAIKLKTNNYEAIAALANLKKHICEFDGAWQLYQHRFELELKDEKRSFEKPTWTDKLIKGKSIYLYCEQGIGDQILYGTMFRDAFETQNNFIVSIDKRLLPIFNRSFTQYNNVEFISKDDEVNESLFDMQLAIGDLGKFFRKSKDDFKTIDPYYFQSNEIKRKALQTQLMTQRKIICGVAWKSASNKIGPDKSLNLRDLEPILSLRDISFFDLQYGDTLEERGTLKRESGISINKVEDIDNFNDIDGLASLIDACDFVVTVSNATAHIAGALGKKVFLMVPYSKGRCWYWHDGLKTSLWYPCIQIFTQTETGDGSVPINEIKEKIVEEILYE
jgi:tetratricopeptide (TPR) repeat protein